MLKSAKPRVNLPTTAHSQPKSPLLLWQELIDQLVERNPSNDERRRSPRAKVRLKIRVRPMPSSTR